MKVIIANINKPIGLVGIYISKLEEACKEMKIDHPIHVNTTEQLLEVLEDNKDDSCLLFTNFPEDSSYRNYEKPLNMNDGENYFSHTRKEDFYSKSKIFYRNIGSKYSIKKTYFITGASERMVKDSYLESLFPNIPVTVKRNNDLLDQGKGYYQSYSDFLIEKIKESISL